MTILDNFNITIEKWIVSLDQYTLEMLLLEPEPGVWSLGQVYMHIINDTGYFVEQMRICLQNDSYSQMEKHENAAAILANNEFPDMLIQGPATYSSVPVPKTKEELVRGLLLIREEVNTLYNEFNFDKSTGKTKHPGLLFFNAIEWLRFAEIHMRHHFRQKKRIDDVLFKV
jgi:hypothetical protein